ncbi:hypothetical protein EK904_011612, partial [Melospiza melodia maxima]
KVQRQIPWSYLGLIITNTQIVPRPVKLDIDIKTAVDVQKLVGAIGWLRPYLRITNHQLQHLYDLLSGITSSADETHLTAASKKMMKYHVDCCVNGMINGKINCIIWNGYFCLSAPGLYELFADIIIKGRRHCHEILGHDPVTIFIPVEQWYFEWCFQNNHELQSALSSFT